ncbi:MAG TPA: fibronectin type III domain-containing protein [Candidatus Paceibacterota bacterium]
MIYTNKFLILFIIASLFWLYVPISLASAPPEITNVSTSTTTTTADIFWRTDNHLSDSKVDYAIHPNSPNIQVSNSCPGYSNAATPTTEHCIRITGLQEGKRYNFKAKSFGIYGINQSGTGEYDDEFTTKDNTPPTNVNLTLPGDNATVSGTAEAAATATDSGSGVSEVVFNISNSTNSYDIGSNPTPSGGDTYHINWNSALYPNGSYTLKATAYDSATPRNQTASAGRTITISNTIGGQGQPDTTAPTAPTNLSGTPSSNSVQLSWSGSTDNVGVTGYEIHRGSALGLNFQLIETVSALSFSNSGLSANTTYTYKVRAKDDAGNLSSFSNTITVVTLGSGENQPPSVPQNVSASPESTTSIKITWNASTDPENNTISYTIYRGTSELTSVNGTSYTDTGLSPSTSYTYKVRAKDSFGALSGFSDAAEATTNSSPQPTPPPPPPGQTGDAKTISGKVIFSNNSAVTDAEVKIYNSSTGSYMTALSSFNGSYSFTVSGGQWTVNIAPLASSNWTWSEPIQTVSFADNSLSEQRTVDFTVPLANAKLSVKVLGPDGRALVGAGVIIDSTSAKDRALGLYSGTTVVGVSDQDGLVSFNLSPGTFYIRARSSEVGFTQPQEKSAQVFSNTETATYIQFGSVKAFITGTARLADGRPTDALIWGWSNDGRTVQTRATSAGQFSLPVSTDLRWRVGASKLEGKTPYRSAEIVVDIRGASVTLGNLVLNAEDITLPDQVSQTTNIQSGSVINLTDRAKIEIPADLVSLAGDLTVSISPTVEVPVQFNNIVGAVYDIDLKDKDGVAITNFNKKITLSFPYTVKLLAGLGITADQLVPSFYDDESGLWVRVADYYVDKLNTRVVASFSHLTRFALVSAADIIPPAPPTQVGAFKTGVNVLLQWVNPKEDFRHTKIYRSAQKGILGSVLFPEVLGSSRVDATVSPGVMYYYVIRSVDPAGNESTNIDQIVPSDGTPKSIHASSISRNLRRGMSGTDVSLLQQTLVTEGVYPEALVTGYFGPLTHAAVVRFQEKYFSEILTPVGLNKGSGFVGPSTRAKLSAVIN